MNDLEFAYDAVRAPWGGATVHLASGRTVPDGVTAYAVADHSLGGTVTLAADVSWPEFAEAFSVAAKSFAGAAFVGVFHDADAGEIHLDPVRVVRTAAEVDEIYTAGAGSGGAYDFSTGLGYWPSDYALAA